MSGRKAGRKKLPERLNITQGIYRVHSICTLLIPRDRLTLRESFARLWAKEKSRHIRVHLQQGTKGFSRFDVPKKTPSPELRCVLISASSLFSDITTGLRINWQLSTGKQPSAASLRATRARFASGYPKWMCKLVACIINK